MFDKLQRKQFLPLFSRCFSVILRVSYSDSALVRSLPKIKAITEKDSNREFVEKFNGNFIEDLFINKFQTDVLKYPEIDTLEEVDSLQNHFSLAQRLITGLSESKNIAPLEVENQSAVSILKNYELIGFKVPRIKNGFGYLQSEYTFLQEALGVNPSLTKTVSEFEDFGIHLIDSFGNEEQKEKYLKKLISGEVTASFANMESGNFLSFETDLLNTNALYSSDTQSFTISGTKVWVYNAQFADLFILLANVGSSKEEKELQPTLFLIDKNVPGVEIHESIKTVGLKNLKISNVTFNKVVVPESSVLGNVSEGAEIIKKILSKGKLSNGGHCLPLMKKFINKAIKHCTCNEFFGKDKHENNYYRVKIGKMMSHLYAVESMTYLLTGRLDSYKNADVFLESLIVKIFASETLENIVQQTIEILGPEFFTSDDNLVELSRDSQFFAACDDANARLRLVLSTAGLKYAMQKKKERSLMEMVDDFFNSQNFLSIIRTKDDLAFKGALQGDLHPMFYTESIVLEDCVYNLSKCTDYLIRKYGENVFERHVELQCLADIVIDIYAMAATLARASRAYCIGTKFQEIDRTSADCETRMLIFHVRKAVDLIFQSKSQDPNFSQVRSPVMNCKYSEFYPVLKNLTLRS